MKSISSLTPDQVATVSHLYQHDHTLLIGNMGAGKTVVTLEAMRCLIEAKQLKRILVIAPLKVCNSVWASEYKEWDVLQDMRIAIATGAPINRLKALGADVDIVVINFENVAWMVDEGLLKGFDGLLVDELTKFKGGGKAFKKLRRYIKQFSWRVGMTGTLVSENIESLFYQMMVVDEGASFGKNKQNYLDKYFFPTDFNRRNWEPKSESLAFITNLISEYVYTMPDYRHELPPIQIIHSPLPLDDASAKAYKEMAKGFATLGVTADSVAAQYTKMQQIAAGFIYGEAGSGDVHYINSTKMDELDRICETVRRAAIGKSAVSQNMIVVYQFKEELERLRAKYGRDLPVLGGGLPAAGTTEIVRRWNRGELPVLALHPRSGGHGLNLARGGHTIVWLSPIWSRDLYDQTNARLWRRGQQHPVTVYVLMGDDTVDLLIASRLDSKADLMPAFIAHLNHWQAKS